jgi:phosphotransferase system HPr-like phosphotransfer protein
MSSLHPVVQAYIDDAKARFEQNPQFAADGLTSEDIAWVTVYGQTNAYAATHDPTDVMLHALLSANVCALVVRGATADEALQELEEAIEAADETAEESNWVQVNSIEDLMALIRSEVGEDDDEGSDTTVEDG